MTIAVAALAWNERKVCASTSSAVYWMSSSIVRCTFGAGDGRRLAHRLERLPGRVAHHALHA